MPVSLRERFPVVAGLWAMTGAGGRPADSLPLKTSRDLRQLRTRLRDLAGTLRMARRALYEFMSACTAVARPLAQMSGSCAVELDVVVEGARVGMRATFTYSLPEGAHEGTGAVVRALTSGLPQHKVEDATQLIDQIDIVHDSDRVLSASIVRWVQ